jgi:hypothetical protein
MSTRAPVRRLIGLLVAMTALLAAAAPVSAQVPGPPDWVAWHMKISFEGQQPHIIYTSYSGTDDPPAVTSWSERDITSNCTVVGNLSYDQNDYAIFDGSSYIRCPLPPKPTGIINCGKGPFWFAADVRLNKQQAVNPLFEGTENGNRMFAFGLPSNGTSARTQLQLLSQSYRSLQWGINDIDGNRMMYGVNGKSIVAVVDYFETLGISWLGFMSNWESFFETGVTGTKIGHLVQNPPASSTMTLSGPIWSHPNVVHIGYSPSTGNYLTGALKQGEIDPPGCRGG